MPLQQAFIAEQAVQCGYCISGILISAAALLKRNPDPSEAEVRARARWQPVPLRCAQSDRAGGAARCQGRRCGMSTGPGLGYHIVDKGERGDVRRQPRTNWRLSIPA